MYTCCNWEIKRYTEKIVRKCVYKSWIDCFARECIRTIAIYTWNLFFKLACWKFKYILFKKSYIFFCVFTFFIYPAPPPNSSKNILVCKYGKYKPIELLLILNKYIVQVRCFGEDIYSIILEHSLSSPVQFAVTQFEILYFWVSANPS